MNECSRDVRRTCLCIQPPFLVPCTDLLECLREEGGASGPGIPGGNCYSLGHISNLFEKNLKMSGDEPWPAAEVLFAFVLKRPRGFLSAKLTSQFQWTFNRTANMFLRPVELAAIDCRRLVTILNKFCFLRIIFGLLVICLSGNVRVRKGES